MVLNTPTYSFSVPSLYDGLEIQCRIYHPYPGREAESCAPFKAAIVGHPYAPMGGSFDVPVVVHVSRTLVKAGYIVATINFRYFHFRKLGLVANCVAL